MTDVSRQGSAHPSQAQQISLLLQVDAVAWVELEVEDREAKVSLLVAVGSLGSTPLPDRMLKLQML